MYVIHRTDKEYGSFTRTHDTLDEAVVEAERLVRQHAKDSPSFTIYELKEAKKLSADFAVKIEDVR